MNRTQLHINLWLYTFLHFIVDAASIAVVLGGIDVQDKLLAFIIIYNILAFGLQLPFGVLFDRIKKPFIATVISGVAITIALLNYQKPMLAVTLVGIGNALFHIGGGTIALNLKPNKASLPGIFVASGGIGLFAGALIVNNLPYNPYYFIVPILTLVILLTFIKQPIVNYIKTKPINISYKRYFKLIVFLLLIVICIRSYVGYSIDFIWKSKTILILALTMGVALGKALGGIFADKFGFLQTATLSLFASFILLAFGSNNAFLSISGMFLFNITMPITLLGISNLLPGQPGKAFGLTTFALIIGALPTFTQYSGFINSFASILAFIALSLILIIIALQLYNKIFTR